MEKALSADIDLNSSRDTPRPLTDHLEELRWRILWSVVSVLLCSIPGYMLFDEFVAHMAKATGPLVFLRPTEAFAVRLETAGLIGFFFSVPFLIYQFWRFVGIALTTDERRVFLGALPFSYILFAAGACLAWFVVVPAGLKVLVSFGSAQMRPALSAQSCLEFALWVTLGMGVLFQIPVVAGILAKWGIVRDDTLRRYRRHALLAILIVSAIVTPSPDVASQLLLAVPAYLLYELSIWIARTLQPVS
jgi:sec-independent protein translocase protein TatC